ncbi:hypothetical protein RNZ50_06460 [Paracoccaceae bacterium Fryx2]|nr:hypothetical protein [Paracoccaceae bacterium Fryx2]
MKCFLRHSARGPLLVLLFGAASPASATPEYILPTLFDVTGVAARDVPDIRLAPDASAAIIGTIPPQTRDIEVVPVACSDRMSDRACGLDVTLILEGAARRGC